MRTNPDARTIKVDKVQLVAKIRENKEKYKKCKTMKNKWIEKNREAWNEYQKINARIQYYKKNSNYAGLLHSKLPEKVATKIELFLINSSMSNTEKFEIASLIVKARHAN